MSTIFLPNINTNAVNYGQLNSISSGLTWMPQAKGISLLYFLSKLGIKSAKEQLGMNSISGQTFFDVITGNCYMIDENGSLVRLSAP